MVVVPRKIVSIKGEFSEPLWFQQMLKPGVASDVIVPTVFITGVDISITFPVELTAFQ